MNLERILDINPRMNETGQRRIFHQLSTMYKNSEEAIREYITNAVDSVGNKGEITVTLDHYSRAIIVQDNGLGMSYQKLSELPVEIGDSEKFGRVDQRGEKGVGILSFGSLGDRLQIISKENGPTNAPHGYLEYWFEGRGNSRELKARVSNTRCENTINELGGSIIHGTRAIINLSEDIYKKNITLDLLKKAISSIYAPLIRNGRISFLIGETTSAQQKTEDFRKILPIETENQILENQILEYRAKKRGTLEDYTLEVFLAFNPNNEQERIAVHSKDVLVYDSILKLDKELKDLRTFACGHVTGYINEPHLKLTLGRDAITSETRGSNAYRGLIHQLKELDSKHWPTIEKNILQKIKDKEEVLLNEAFRRLQDIYRIVGAPLDITRRRRGENPRPNDDDDNEENPKNQKLRKLPFKVIGREFDLHERKERSLLGEDITGSPLVEINTGHEDYTQVIRENNPDEQINYIYRLAIPRIVQGEAESAIRKGKLNTEEAPLRISTRIEQLSFAALPVKTKKRSIKRKRD